MLHKTYIYSLYVAAPFDERNRVQTQKQIICPLWRTDIFFNIASYRMYKGLSME